MQNDVQQLAPSARTMHLPIGCSNFSDIINKKLDFVDKTLFIKEIFDNRETTVTVITRPRRFGKTLNLSMLRHFLTESVHGQPTRELFNGLKIAEIGNSYLQFQGRYPVIFVTFKDIKNHNYETAYANLCHQLAQIYSEHQHLLSSVKLTSHDKEIFLSILEERAAPTQVGTCLKDLCNFLYQHHGVKPWILIDEYDTPIQSGYLNGYYEQIISLMRSLLGSALKDNDFLDRAVITGILKISKESLFSGANNIKVCSLFDNEYSEYFGFTETEVEQLLKKASLYEHYPAIRQWYNGYQIGQSVIYNPWSLINCIQKQGLLKPYWINTSGNDLVKHLLAQGDAAVKKDLETLIQGESITAMIDENMVFSDLKKIPSIWSLLLFTGYLKVIHKEPKRSHLQCELAAPNQEVLFLYQDVVRDWLLDPLGEQYLEFLLSLTEGRMEEFSERLQDYLIKTMGIFDTSGQEPEKFYHGLVLGMIVSLSDTHEVKSNRESGYGRYDVMIIPKDSEQLGIILEFKTVRDHKIQLNTAAADALQQIKDRRYAEELRLRGIQKILAIGLAFHGKQVAVVWQD